MYIQTKNKTEYEYSVYKDRLIVERVLKVAKKTIKGKYRIYCGRRFGELGVRVKSKEDLDSFTNTIAESVATNFGYMQILHVGYFDQDYIVRLLIPTIRHKDEYQIEKGERLYWTKIRKVNYSGTKEILA